MFGQGGYDGFLGLFPTSVGCVVLFQGDLRDDLHLFADPSFMDISSESSSSGTEEGWIKNCLLLLDGWLEW